MSCVHTSPPLGYIDYDCIYIYICFGDRKREEERDAHNHTASSNAPVDDALSVMKGVSGRC